MTHELKDTLVLLCAIAGTLAAFLGPWLMRSDVRRSMAENWGQMKATVENHGETLERHENKLSDHDERLQDHGERLAAGHL